MATRDELAQQASALSIDDRAYLADVLEESLGQGEFATPEIAEAWKVEIERRVQAHERGELKSEDWQTVMQRLRAERSSQNP